MYSNFPSRLKSWATTLENILIVLFFLAMLGLASGQIILRLFFSSGFMWTDEMIRIIILWLTMVASISATRSDRHLRIDLLSHLLPIRYKLLVRSIADLFATIITSVLAWHSLRYINLLHNFQDTVLDAVPAWIIYSIVPISFILMSYRFLLLTIHGSISFLRKDFVRTESL